MPQITVKDLEGSVDPDRTPDTGAAGGENSQEALASDPNETVGLSAKVVADAIAADWEVLASRLPVGALRRP
jgi:hypothetical protein